MPFFAVLCSQDDEIIDLDLDESDELEAVVIEDDEIDNTSNNDYGNKEETTISLIDLTDDSQDSDIGIVSSSTEVSNCCGIFSPRSG